MDGTGRRRASRAPVWILLLVAALLFLTAGALLLRQHYADRRSLPSWPDVEGIDPGAQEIPLRLTTRLFGVQQNDETTFTYTISKKAEVLAASKTAALQIANPIENRYLMAVEITLAGDDRVLFRSGYLKPNQRLESVTFDELPAAGTYEAVAYFCAVDFDTQDLLGILEQPITLTVKGA